MGRGRACIAADEGVDKEGTDTEGGERSREREGEDGDQEQAEDQTHASQVKLTF